MTPDITSQFIGTWRLISYSAAASYGPTTYPFGMNAQGRLIYDARGRMAVQIARPGQAPFASGDPRLPTAAEAQDAYARYLAYFGTFTVEPDRERVVHHVEVSLTPDWSGSDLVRQYELDGKRLILTTLVWEKLP